MSKEYIKAQTPLPAYFPYPKFLLQMSLSHTARLTYVLLLDRMTLSQKNGWVDVQGRAYVLYPLAGLAEDLQSSISSVTRALRELEAARLIERRSNGFSKPNQVFLSFPSTAQKCTAEMVKNEQPDCSKVSNTIAQNCTSNQINKNNLRLNQLSRTKEAYGRYRNVFLEDYSELEMEIAELDTLIEDLSAYMQSTGRKYADHAATLRSWSARKRKQQKPGTGIPDYTESLEVQISYIKEYINHRDDLMLLDVFADKRCTGMNFDRPEFERLLKALQERKIDCIPPVWIPAGPE